MFGRKNEDRSNVLVTVISGLTSRESDKMFKHITKGKNKYASSARGTCVKSTLDGVSKALSSNRHLLGK